MRQGIRRSRHRYWVSYGFVGPYMLLFFLFTVIPVISAIVLSFTYYNVIQPPQFNGLANYIRLFLEDDVFLIGVKNTLLFALITGPVSYLACLLIAWMISDFPPKLRALLTLIFYAPSISGAVYTIWGILFSSDSLGYVNSFLLNLGILHEPVQWLQDPSYVLSIIILVQIWLSLGTSFLAFISGFQGLDRSLFEAGAVDGIRNRWQELWYITLPSMRPLLMFGAVMQITASFSVSDVSINLAGFPSVDYAAETVVTHLMDYGTIRFELGYSCAIATFLFVVMVAANRIVQSLLKKIGA